MLLRALAVLLLVIVPARGQSPIYHGDLTIHPAAGSFDPVTGAANLTVRAWGLKLSSLSDGIAPDRQVMLVALADDTFRIAAGDAHALRAGRVFSYRGPRGMLRGIVALRLQRVGEDYRVRLVLRGLDLSRLISVPFACVPVAVIVGDDDGFTGILLQLSSSDPHHARRVRVVGGCTPTGGWPWLGR